MIIVTKKQLNDHNYFLFVFRSRLLTSFVLLCHSFVSYYRRRCHNNVVTYVHVGRSCRIHDRFGAVLSMLAATARYHNRRWLEHNFLDRTPVCCCCCCCCCCGGGISPPVVRSHLVSVSVSSLRCGLLFPGSSSSSSSSSSWCY